MHSRKRGHGPLLFICVNRINCVIIYTLWNTMHVKSIKTVVCNQQPSNVPNFEIVDCLSHVLQSLASQISHSLTNLLMFLTLHDRKKYLYNIRQKRTILAVIFAHIFRNTEPIFYRSRIVNSFL